MLRKLLAYRYLQAGFQSSLVETLRGSSTATLQTNAEMGLFLGGQADEEERIKHGMPMPRKDWPIEEEYADSVDLPEWNTQVKSYTAHTLITPLAWGSLSPR